MKKNKIIIAGMLVVLFCVVALASWKLWIWYQDIDATHSIEMIENLKQKVGVYFPDGSHLIRFKESTFRDIIIYASVSIPSPKLAEFKSTAPINRIEFMKMDAERGCKDLELSFNQKFHPNSISYWEYGTTNDYTRGDSINVYIEYLIDGTSVVYIMYFK